MMESSIEVRFPLEIKVWLLQFCQEQRPEVTSGEWKMTKAEGAIQSLVVNMLFHRDTNGILMR